MSHILFLRPPAPLAPLPSNNFAKPGLAVVTHSLPSLRHPSPPPLPRSEFAKLGLTRSVGGVLGLALSRELTPVVTCIILAGALKFIFFPS